MPLSGAMNDGTQPVIFLSSHDFNAFNNSMTLSALPCLMSSMLTDPKRMSLTKKKSNRLKRPSGFPSFSPEGCEEPAAGGKIGLPLIDSAILTKFGPLQLWTSAN